MLVGATCQREPTFSAQSVDALRWEGNRRSVMALAVRYRLQWYTSTYGLKAYSKESSQYLAL